MKLPETILSHVKKTESEQYYVVRFAFSAHVLGPNRHLHLAYVRLLEQQHTYAGLTESAAYCERQRAVKNALMIGELFSFERIRLFKLPVQTFFVNSDTHG